MASSPPLSPRAAVILGTLVAIAGVVPILGATGVIDLKPTPGTPTWVGATAGLVFVFGGLAVMNGSTMGSSRARVGMQTLLGVAICAAFAAIAGWIAFGPGERQFASTISLPFYAHSGRGSEWLGRGMFGLGAIGSAALGMAFLVRDFGGRQ